MLPHRGWRNDCILSGRANAKEETLFGRVALRSYEDHAYAGQLIGEALFRPFITIGGRTA